MLSKAANLQTLSLKQCNRLTALPEFITSLQRLTVLVVECPHLATLPQNIAALNLQELQLVACGALKELPEYLPKTLQVLSLHGCSRLTALPPSIGELAHLHFLDLSGCTALIDIPGSLAQCPKLDQVQFGWHPELERALGFNVLWQCSSARKQDLPERLKELGERLSRHKAVLKLSSDQLHMTESLERLSWLAVMLATATFVGFLQPPFGTLRYDNQDVNKGMPSANRIFFLLDAWSFLLSLSALVVIVVISMPHIPSSSVRREAGRFWVLLCAAWGLLYFAIMTGAGAFVASAFAVYGRLDIRGLIAPLVVGVVLLFFGLLSLVWRLLLLFPGSGVLVEGIAQIWKNDLPFCYLFPCTNLLAYLACTHIRFKRNDNMSAWQKTAVYWVEDRAADWRAYLVKHHVVSQSFIDRHRERVTGGVSQVV